LAVLLAGADDIDPGGFDAAVAQNVRKLGNVFLNSVKGPGEELSQAVGENLPGIHACPGAEPLHQSPDAAPVQRCSVSADEDRSGAELFFLRVVQQKPSKLPGDQHRPGLSLAPDHRLSLAHSLESEIFQLRHPDPGAADGFQNQLQLWLIPRRGHKTEVFLPGQLLFLGTVDLFLLPDSPDPALREPQPPKKAVEAGKHRVDGPDGVAAVQKLLLIVQGNFLGNRPPRKKYSKSTDIPEILLQGGRAFLFMDQIPPKVQNPLSSDSVLNHNGSSCWAFFVLYPKIKKSLEFMTLNYKNPNFLWYYVGNSTAEVIHMKEKACKECRHYHRHYAVAEGRIFQVNCGHCTLERPKRRRPDGKACPRFEQGEPDEAAFVTKKYLTKALLHRVLDLPLFPENEDGER